MCCCALQLFLFEALASCFTRVFPVRELSLPAWSWHVSIWPEKLIFTIIVTNSNPSKYLETWMELRSSGHDPTCALFITQEHVVPLPFPKPLSNLMTPKHWLQEPHLTTLHKHSGLPSMCSQYKPAQTQMKLSVAMLPGHQITKHRS